MNCKYYRHLLVLDSSGIINNDQKKNLTDHLENCADCRKYQASLTNSDQLIAKMKTSISLPENPETITNYVMNAIQNIDNTTFKSKWIRFLDYILFILDLKRVKYSLFIVSIVIAAIFVSQQFIIYREVKNLKKQVQQSRFTVSRNKILKEKKIRILTNHLELNNEGKEILELIQINKDDFEKLMEDYKNLQIENEILKGLLNDSLYKKYDQMKSKDHILNKIEKIHKPNNEKI